MFLATRLLRPFRPCSSFHNSLFRSHPIRSMITPSSLEEAYHSSENNLEDSRVQCMVIHPVSYPNHGPTIELSLASEALGLVKALDWEISDGPKAKD